MHHIYRCAGRTLRIEKRAEAIGRYTNVNFALGACP